MLDGFLTTALEIIIILDVCGAVVYVLAFSLRRASQKRAEETSEASLTPGFAYGQTLSPAFAASAPVGSPVQASDGPPPLPEWAQEAVDRHNAPTRHPRIDFAVDSDEVRADVETEIADSEKTKKRFDWVVGLRTKLSTLAHRLIWKRKQGQEKAERTDIESDRARLHRVLDSFREEG